MRFRSGEFEEPGGREEAVKVKEEEEELTWRQPATVTLLSVATFKADRTKSPKRGE